MRRIIVQEFLTLGGVMQAPGILDVTEYVVSTTMEDDEVAGSGWQNSKLLKSIEGVKDLKKESGAEPKHPTS